MYFKCFNSTQMTKKWPFGGLVLALGPQLDKGNIKILFFNTTFYFLLIIKSSFV